jgi:hypothetical protein
MPVEATDIATTSEDIAATPEAVMPAIPSAPLILFGAGGHRYRNQSCNGQRLDNKSSINVHDRSFQGELFFRPAQSDLVDGEVNQPYIPFFSPREW